MVNVGSLIASIITEWELQYDIVYFQFKAKKLWVTTLYV